MIAGAGPARYPSPSGWKLASAGPPCPASPDGRGGRRHVAREASSGMVNAGPDWAGGVMVNVNHNRLMVNINHDRAMVNINHNQLRVNVNHNRVRVNGPIGAGSGPIPPTRGDWPPTRGDWAPRQNDPPAHQFSQGLDSPARACRIGLTPGNPPEPHRRPPCRPPLTPPN